MARKILPVALALIIAASLSGCAINSYKAPGEAAGTPVRVGK